MVVDWWIALKVRLRPAWEFLGLSDCLSIGVRCRERHITLSGSVRNEYRQCRAEEAARRVRGLGGLTNRITVRESLRLQQGTRALVGPWPLPAHSEITVEEPPEDGRPTSEAVLQALSETGVPTQEGAVRVYSVGRTVYLLGNAHDSATAETAKRVASALPQVDRVRNKLQGAAGGPEAGLGGQSSESHRLRETPE